MTERIDSIGRVPTTLQPPYSGSGHVPVQRSHVALAPNPPEVYAFQDFRAYLTAWFQWKKQVQPQYSGAIFAKKAGFNSHTLLGMVIRGQRNLSATSIRAFCRALGLKAKEAIYFEKLVLLNQARNSDDQAYYFEQLQQVTRASHEMATLTLAMDRKVLHQLMDRIDEFRKQISSEFSVIEREADLVVAVNMAVTTLSDVEK